MRDEHPTELQKLGRELSPTAEEVSALIDGSLEADREPPETLGLLDALPAPTTADVRALKASVIDTMDHPTARPVPMWAIALVAGGVALAGAALWLSQVTGN